MVKSATQSGTIITSDYYSCSEAGQETAIYGLTITADQCQNRGHESQPQWSVFKKIHRRLSISSDLNLEDREGNKEITSRRIKATTIS
jgi:hypothetical protein